MFGTGETHYRITIVINGVHVPHTRCLLLLEINEIPAEPEKGPETQAAATLRDNELSVTVACYGDAVNAAFPTADHRRRARLLYPLSSKTTLRCVS